MTFEVIPVIDLMLALYEKPLAPARFRDYLALLEGNTKGDLALPIGGYNPMAKDYARNRLQELKTLGAEDIAASVAEELNGLLSGQHTGKTIRMAINLSDDLMGGWTNRYTSDYDSKFKINALLSRNFCTPVFWTGETFSPDMIRQRILEYAWRSIYRQTHPPPLSLQEHVAQEAFVARQAPAHIALPDNMKAAVEALYQEYKNSDDYHTIFHFLYGSNACASLAFPVRSELEDFAGYRYSASLADHGFISLCP